MAKAISKLTKPEALAELEELSKTVEYGEDEFNENTPVKELRLLVREGREVLESEEDETPPTTETSDESKKAEGKEDKEPPRLTKSDDDSYVEPKVVKAGEGDYLRQYQCKKITVDGKTWHAVGGKETDPDAGSKAEKMKAFLLKQPRISTLIYPEPGSAAAIPLTVCLNGYRLDLPKNTWLEVPEPVAAVIRKSQQQQIAAIDIPEKIDPEKVSSALKG